MALNITDMAPGTTFTAEGFGVPGSPHRFTVTDKIDPAGYRYLRCATHDGNGAIASYVDSSTIRDVTLPTTDGEGAPRQAGTATGDPTGQVRRDLEMVGVMTSVRLLTPASAGHAVRILVGDGHATGVLHLEPQQASDLAHQLLADAQDAIYADRAVRRG